MLDFINVGTHCNFVTKSAQLRVKIRNFQISYLRSTNLTCSECPISKHWKYISFLGPNFPGIRGMILALMSTVCYLAITFIFFGGYLVVTARYLVVTACYRSTLLLSTFSMNARNFSMNARNNNNS